ncbi:MAG: type II toxin-antitoxin system HicB family antitoxin [Acidobacteriia bacterium]|nr:type II toxin-antitoxin system HicB family antitoxin [Terriglobia bacterium]
MAPLDKIFGEKEEVRATVQIPILCRFSREEDVWNGSAEDLPVAVFGKTFEEAQRNLSDAIIAHLESVQEVGDLKATIERLRSSAKDRRFSVEEMTFDQPLVRFNAALQDHRITALV